MHTVHGARFDVLPGVEEFTPEALVAFLYSPASSLDTFPPSIKEQFHKIRELAERGRGYEQDSGYSETRRPEWLFCTFQTSNRQADVIYAAL